MHTHTGVHAAPDVDAHMHTYMRSAACARRTQVRYLGADECGVYAKPLEPGQRRKCRKPPARAFCRNPLQAESTICPAAYRELYGFARERQLGVLFVNFETHAWGRDPLDNATGRELVVEIQRREEAHVRQARGPQKSRVLKKPRPCTPW